ncbi:MAG TPA: cyanophycinase [Pyrinomonadaceae bacterium]|nr:cyanophycinase [Pyrinomonadaceae bacterium]
MAVKRLLAIGGNEDREGKCEILKRFVEMSGGAKSEILLMTIATEEVDETIKDYRKVFRRLGARHIKAFDISKREDTAAKRGLSLIENATGIFFSGGDQLDISALLGGTDMLKLIQDHHCQGCVIAGTSAGAAMMSSSMLISGKPEESPRFGNVELGPGLDFIRGTIIDTHFSQRGRCGRLMTAVAHYPQDIGIGIDEDTAILVNGMDFKVLGSGSVIVVDGGPMTHTNLNNLKHGELLELHDLTVHVLPAGARFDLKKQRPAVDHRKGSAAA